MNKHTPGPWLAQKADGGYVVCELTEGWCVVALEEDPNKYSAEADAILIAFAPKMEASLNRIHRLSLENMEPDDLLELIRIEAVNALRGAKGEQG